METIAWIGFSQGLFAAILIMTKKERSVSDRLLVAWLSLLSIEFLSCAIDYRYFGYPLLTSSFILFNPAFYLYVKSLVNVNYKLKWVHLLHLVPFIFFEILTYILHEPYSLGNFFILDSTLWFRSFFSIASVVSWVAYNYATANSILKHRSTLVNEFSNIESYKKVGWLLFVVVFYNLYCLTLVLVSIISILRIGIPLIPLYNYSALLIMVYILGFYGLKQQVIYKESQRTLFLEERYSKSQLSVDKKARIKSRIIKYFETEKPYLNPELSMDFLSESLKIPKHHLTEVLNVEIGKNFFQFVNEYRVEAVKVQLMDSRNLYSIEAIGYDCGFSSKSSFFTVFKKLTGKTPQEYRNTDR
jgi:AraC-like DNA-binding protein